jgi:hypothetical protein
VEGTKITHPRMNKLKFNNCDFSVYLEQVNKRFDYNFTSIEVTDTTSYHIFKRDLPIYRKVITTKLTDNDGDWMAYDLLFSVHGEMHPKNYWGKKRLYKYFTKTNIFLGNMENGFYKFIRDKKIRVWKERK